MRSFVVVLCGIGLLAMGFAIQASTGPIPLNQL
jgi:hypothetical protein